MKAKKGEGYISVCILIITICIILSVFITFASCVNIVRLVKRNTKTVLENYVTDTSIKIFNSIKQGSNDLDSLDAYSFTSVLKDYCTFEKSSGYMYHKDADGNVDYYVSAPHIGYTEKGKLRLYAEYTLYVPICFDSVKIATAEIPIKVYVDLDEKY